MEATNLFPCRYAVPFPGTPTTKSTIANLTAELAHVSAQ